VKYPLFLSDFNETCIFRQIFEKSSNIKFYQNPASSIRVVPCGQTGRRTDMTQLIVAFRNFANATKKITGTLLICSKMADLEVNIMNADLCRVTDRT
jgi:hypothetical protein